MDGDNRPRKPGRVYQNSLFWPVVLITIGVVFLLRNLGSLNGDAWEVILNLWPLLLIVLGLDGILQQHGLAWPILLIGLGTVLLLHNFGLLAWRIVDLLLRLWPVLLVAVGLDIVAGRRSKWGALLAAVLTLAILIGSVWYFGSSLAAGAEWLGAVESHPVSQALGSAEQASVGLHPAIGSLRVGVLEDSNDLIQGEINRWKGETILEEHGMRGGKGEFTLRSSGLAVLYPGTQGVRWGWDMLVSPRLPLDLDVSLGVGEVYLDLQSLQIATLDVSVGMGRTVLILPAEGDCAGRIDGAIGELLIFVPEEMGLRIRSETGLANVNVPDGYAMDDGDYVSPGYANADDRTELWINQAIGRVVVMPY